MLHEKDQHLKGVEGALPRTIGKKSKKVPKGEKESSIQTRVEEYCNLLGLKFIRVPDLVYNILFNGKNKIPAHVKFIVSKYLKGLPDITILKPSETFNKALLLEIKRTGGKTSQGQKNWHKGVNVVIGEGWEECKKAIDEFNKE